VDHVIQMSGLIEHFKKEKGERARAASENLLELVSAAKGFSPEGETDMQPLESFLAHAVLESERVRRILRRLRQMMTAYGQGLGIPVVFWRAWKWLVPASTLRSRTFGELGRGAPASAYVAPPGEGAHLRQLYIDLCRAAPPLWRRPVRPAFALHRRLRRI